MAAHMVGMMEGFSSFRSLAHLMRKGKKAAGDGKLVDGLTSVQVAERAHLSTDELVAESAELGPRQARWRGSRPGLMRRAPMKEEVGGTPETWKMGYLFDVILTRDPWMHRVDISRATGHPMVLTAEHDGRLVADVVAEWARRHGQPFELHLGGPAGGEYTQGEGGEVITHRRRRVLPHPLRPGHGDRPAHPGGSVLMETRVTEVADGIHQLTTYVDVADFSFNQYLVTGDEPLLFHTGGRQLFPLVSEAISKVMPVESLRWISFGHVESDESGSMNDFLARAPAATVAQSVIGCMVSLNDLADRPPRPLGDGEVLDIGGHRLRWIDTPHVPHGWETGVLYDETTKTLLCGDLFTRQGAYDAASDDDVVGPAVAAEDVYGGIVAGADHRRHPPRPRRARRRHAGPHARPGVRRRLPRRRCSTWPTTSTGGSPPLA